MSEVAIVGAGPAGLMAAETLAGLGHVVTVYDRMPSAGRKFLLAGRGGLNLTHSEGATAFAARYGEASHWMAPVLRRFPPDWLRAWCDGLDQPVFVGSSGRVFPATFKAAPLLRAWLRRLDALGVRFVARHRWTGWTQDGNLAFDTGCGVQTVRADGVLLALGGASWPRMGSDGGWVDIVRAQGVVVAALRASNCGVDVAWSSPFLSRFEGQPLKRVAVYMAGQCVRGDVIVTRAGLEGGPVYALSPAIRSALDREGQATLWFDLRPDLTTSDLAARVDGARQGRSLSNVLRQAAGLPPVAIGLVQEAIHGGQSHAGLAALVKAVAVHIVGTQPIERSISSAGGISLTEIDEHLMVRRMPGVFVAGEMLDWEAPTGGYLLQGCFSTGALAGNGMACWLRGQACAATASR